MRLFTGLDLPPDVIASLESLLDQLRPAAPIQWSPPSNLHITTKFIGEWPQERLADLTAALAAIPGRQPIQVRISGLGFFPSARSPRVFWCGIDAPGLAELAFDTDRAAAALGIASESRAFSAHLTLARIKERLPLEALREKIAALPPRDIGRFEAPAFFLHRSQLRRGGSVYSKLSEFPLVK